MSQLNLLKAATGLREIATLLSVSPSSLSYLLYVKSASENYRQFEISKRNGGSRSICAPTTSLKIIQRNLADVLQDCLDEMHESSGRKDRTSHGFTRGRSIMTNASRHRHRKIVFNIDLEDFFPSINFGRVRGFFIKNRDFALDPRAATVIAQIACHSGSLPQGSPCSPVIANLIAHVLDMRLVTLAIENGCTYSRYADDLTFSSNKPVLPPTIAALASTGDQGFHVWHIGARLRDAIERSGFRVNEAKTHLMYNASRQQVTGLIVNERIGVASEYRKNVRAMVHRLVKTGSFEIFATDSGNVPQKRLGALEELQGMLGFIDSVNIYSKGEPKKQKVTQLSADERTHRTFLFYRTFHVANAPVIICEGETDNVYLTHAIRSLAVDFPELASIDEEEIVRIKTRLYKYPRSSTARLIGLKGGGSEQLKQFIQNYESEMRGFSGSGLVHPVIVLFDNDDGAREIWAAIRRLKKPQVVDNLPFIHLVRNMYAVPVPGSKSRIEDCFGDAIKKTTIDGKVFNEKNVIDSDKEFGKMVFAHKVVRTNAESIDFSGFRPLLTNIVGVIKDYELRKVVDVPTPVR